jgi:predicted Zn-dependent peptidase
MWMNRASAIALAGALVVLAACQDKQETQKFERADADTFRRDMSALTSITLANGVSLYVQEERTDDQVAVEVLYRSGFNVEPKGQAQISHLTEHAAIHCAMGNFGPGESRAAIQKDRGLLNAEAVADFVHIDYIVAGTRLEEVFQIESERLRAIRCDQQTLDKEKPQVTGEIDAVIKDPKGVLTKFAMMALNQTYRFGLLNVSLQSQVPKFRIEDVHRFHDATYRPDDMIVVVIGNIKTADAESLARKYFEPVPRRPAPPLPKPVLTKSVAATWDINAMAVYFVAPGSFDDRERLLLTMFGSYFHQFLQTSSGVYSATRSIYCSNQVYRVADLPFFIFAEPLHDGSVSEVSDILLDHLDRALATLDEDVTIESIKGNLVTYVTSSMLRPDVADYPLAHYQVIGQEALNVGMKHILREGRSTDEFTTEVMSVTPDEMRTVVRKYIARERLIRVTFTPRA